MDLMNSTLRKRFAVRLSLILLGGVGWFFAASNALAQKAGEDKTGLAVGAKAPEFKLKDQNGKEVSLADLLKKGKVAVVFHRSADW